MKDQDNINRPADETPIATPVEYDTSSATIRDANDFPVCHFAQLKPYVTSLDEKTAHYIVKVLNEHKSMKEARVERTPPDNL